MANFECTPMIGSGEMIGEAVPQAPDRHEITFPDKRLGSFVVVAVGAKIPKEVLAEALIKHDGFDIPNICDRNPLAAADFSDHLRSLVDPQAPSTSTDQLPVSRSEALNSIFQRQVPVIFIPSQCA